MRVPPDHPLARTHALRRPETVLPATEALRGATGPAAAEGLIEILHDPPSARAATAAIDALEKCGVPIVLDALRAALGSPHTSVRIAAVQDLHRRRARGADGDLLRLLRRDPSWLVRRAALRALADGPDPIRRQILAAVTDPHWRVRHALIQVLLGWGETETQRAEIDRRLAEAGSGPRAQGVRVYLRYRWTGEVPTGESVPLPEDPKQRCPFWDWDAAVLARTVERMSDAERQAAIGTMPFLLGHPDERVSALAAEVLRDHGEAAHLAEALALLDDPRHGAGDSLAKLLEQLDLDRTEEVARFLLHRPDASPAALAWALDQAGDVFPPEEEAPRLLDLARRAESQPAEVRSALARLAARWGCPETGDLLRRLLDDPAPEAQAEALRGLGRRPDVPVGEEVLAPLLASENATVRAEAVRTWVRRGGETSRLGPLADDSDVRVRLALAESLAGRDDPLLSRLQADPHPHVRAAALTPSRAAELIEDPTRETSWHVLTKAARLRKVPIWEIEPDPPWRPERAPPVPAEALHLERPAPPAARLLGPGRLAVSPIGVSGHYGLPVEGFVRAAEQGVSLMFWEPNYQTLTDFFARLSPAARRAIHLITGTFEADGDRVRRDAERALRLLNVERLALFLIFWVQSWDRITPDVREALERLKAQGKVAGYGLSMHSWALAAEAIDAGWDPVMTRHSAAHRRAEEHVFPHAVRRGTSVLTFSNTCYGRLLKPAGDLPPPQPSDCLRYTLRQPGVTACVTAPATVEFLEENLRAMREPELPEDRLRHLLACGERVYQEDTTFRKLVRAL